MNEDKESYNGGIEENIEVDGNLPDEEDIPESYQQMEGRELEEYIEHQVKALNAAKMNGEKEEMERRKDHIGKAMDELRRRKMIRADRDMSDRARGRFLTRTEYEVCEDSDTHSEERI